MLAANLEAVRKRELSYSNAIVALASAGRRDAGTMRPQGRKPRLVHRCARDSVDEAAISILEPTHAALQDQKPRFVHRLTFDSVDEAAISILLASSSDLSGPKHAPRPRAGVASRGRGTLSGPQDESSPPAAAMRSSG